MLLPVLRVPLHIVGSTVSDPWHWYRTPLVTVTCRKPLIPIEDSCVCKVDIQRAIIELGVVYILGLKEAHSDHEGKKK